MKKLYIALLAAALTLPAMAQEMNSAYFVDGYKYRHRLNPALAPTRSYFSLPALGGISANVRSDMGMKTFLYPYENGQLTTFMNGSVSSEEFLSQLKRNNDLNVNANLNLLSIGVWGKNGFTSAELSLKIGAQANLPYGLFDFMKNVGASQSYNFSNIDARAQAYAELALGHAHRINDNLNIGAKVKFIVGVGRANAHVDKLNVVMNQDKWSVTAAGEISSSVPGLVIPTKGETGSATGPADANQIDFSGIEMSTEELLANLRPSGYGAAIDLGAEYKFDDGLLEGLNVSAAVLDLGFISWGGNNFYATTSDKSWEFSGFDNVSFEEGSENSIGSQFEGLADDLSELIIFEKQDAVKSGASMLACTINLGAEYEMPFYRKLSAGFLYSSRISGLYSKHEGRFSANINPVKWFGFSASYGISNYGSSLGAVMNFDFPGFGLFIGTDSAILNVTPPIEDLGGVGLPYGKLNFDVYFGISFNMGKYRVFGDRD